MLLSQQGLKGPKSRRQNRTPEWDRPADIHPGGAPRSPPPPTPHPAPPAPLSAYTSLTNPPCSSATRSSLRWSRRRCSSLGFCARGGKSDESQRGETWKRVIRWLGLTQHIAILLNKNETSQRSLTRGLTDCGELPVQGKKKKTSIGTTVNVTRAWRKSK